MGITFGSVCSGIEAASVAWHPLGWRAAWLAEIEPFPSAVLAHHYPDVPNLGDMTRLVRRILSGEIAAPDVFTGGTPCQAFSVAGQRQSLDDARGNLTLTFVDIANAIDHVRTAAGREPCVIKWENVPGVLNTRDNAYGCFLGALAGSGCELFPTGHRTGQPVRWPNAGCVYGPRRAVAWRVLDAQYFGLAQRRRRVFVVASARNGFDPAAVLFESDGLRRDSAPRRETREGTAGTLAGGARQRGGYSTDDVGMIPALARCVTTGEAKRQDWETCTIIPAPTADCIGTLTSAGGNAVPGNTVQDAVAHQLIPMTAHTLRAEGFDASEDGTGRGTPLAPVAYAMNQITSPGNRSNPQPGDPAPTLGTFGEVPAIAFSCKDSGQDAGELSPTLRAMGHAGSHPNAGGQVAVALAFPATLSNSGVDVELSPTLGAHNNGTNNPATLHAMAVRRLTPVECERLQGFPDDYTAIPWRGKPAADCPDGPRYKALGNSWAVPCARWIGERIARALA